MSSNQERWDLGWALAHQTTQNGTLTRSGLLKSRNLVKCLKQERWGPVGGQQFTQHTDRFVIDDDDMDSNTATESDPLFQITFILTQGEWSIFMEKNYSENLHSIKNTGNNLTMKQMSGSCSLTTLIWVLSLIRPQHLRTKLKASLIPACCRAFGQSSRKRIPRLLGCLRLLCFYQMATVSFVLGRGRAPNLRRYAFSDCGTRIRKDLVLEEGTNTSRESTTANGPSCLARNQSGFFIILAISYNHLSSCQPPVSEWFQRKGKSEQFWEIVYPRAKVISIQAPQYRQYALISGFLDFANLSIREEGSIGHELDQGPGRVEASEPCLGHYDRPRCKQSTEKCDCRFNTCESLGSGRQLIFHGNPSAIARAFSAQMAVFRRHFW